MPRLIDADALWEQVDSLIKPSSTEGAIIFQQGLALIEDAPTVDAEPVKHGHWINHFDDLFPEDSSVECSVCHEYEGIMANDNYCPNCGAKMDEVDERGKGNL